MSISDIIVYNSCTLGESAAAERTRAASDRASNSVRGGGPNEHDQRTGTGDRGGEPDLDLQRARGRLPHGEPPRGVKGRPFPGHGPGSAWCAILNALLVGQEQDSIRQRLRPYGGVNSQPQGPTGIRRTLMTQLSRSAEAIQPVAPRPGPRIVTPVRTSVEMVRRKLPLVGGAGSADDSLTHYNRWLCIGCGG